MKRRASVIGLAGLLAGLSYFGVLGGVGAVETRPVAVAQLLPPGSVPDADAQGGEDSSNISIRLNRLEGALRQANGEIEQLQNDNQRLQAELKRFREDVEFRLSGAKAPPLVATPPGVAAPPAPAELKPRRSDAFDPGNSPNAQGAPQPLGSTAPSAPLANGLEFKPGAGAVGAPLELGPRSAATPPPTTPSGPLQPSPSGPMVVGSGLDFSDAPREQFNAAVEAYKAGQYDTAESQLKAFLAANGGHRLVPEAVFYLGETYLQRSRPREAAEQYLKLSTDFAKSPRAPDGMLRLGESLALLGNNEQACATFSEIGRRYPTASTNVKKAIEREKTKDHC